MTAIEDARPDHAELRRLAEQANAVTTGNPWIADSGGIVLDPDRVGNSWDGTVVCETTDADNATHRKWILRDYIAAANPTAMLALIAEHERLTEALEGSEQSRLAGEKKLARVQAEHERLTTPPTDDEHDPRCAKRRHFLGGTVCDCKPPTDDEREALTLDAVYEVVCQDHGVQALVEHARRQAEYCCQYGCGSGACETCPCCAAGWCIGGSDGVPDDPDDLARWVEVAAEHNPVVAAGFRRQGPITDEWEWGAIWTNGVIEGKWFDMGDSFAIREAAERQVDGYVDPQIVLGRRRKAGPWEPVETDAD